MEPHISLRPAALALLFACLACAAGAADSETDRIRMGRDLPELPADSFAELSGFAPTPRELSGRVAVFVTFQAGKRGELDLALELVDELDDLQDGDDLIVLGVATCLDTRRDALSLDDAYILNAIGLSQHKDARIVRDHDERFWQRVLVRSANGQRQGTPAIVVVDAGGRVFYTGFVNNKKLELRAHRAVRAALALALDPGHGTLAPEVRPAADDYAAERFDRALRQLEGLLDDEDLDPGAAADAAELLFLIDLRFETEMNVIEERIAEGRMEEALDALSKLRKLFGSSDYADEVKERQDVIEEDEALQLERKAERAVGKVFEGDTLHELKTEKDRFSLAKKLRKAAARYEGTRNAAKALARAKELDPAGQ